MLCLRDVLEVPKVALEGRRQVLGEPGVLEDALQVDAVSRVGGQGLDDEVFQFRGCVDPFWEAKFPPTSSACA